MTDFLDSWRSGGKGKGPYILQSRTADEKPLIVRGASGQTANIFEVQNSAETTLFAIDASGNLTLTGAVTMQIDLAVAGSISLTGNLSVAGTSSFTGLATFASLTVTGNTVLNDVAVNHNLTVNNNLAANGNTTLEQLIVKNSASYGGGITQTATTIQTTNATQTTLATLQVNANESWSVEVLVVGMETSASSSARAIYKLNGVFYRSGSGNITQQGDTVSTITVESNEAWDASFTLDTTAQTIKVSVTGAAATTINWKAYLTYFKVQ